ncbi:hypothetical protein [Arthrobacter psychrolactophilus]|uniref:hypothetical protein n=1 Tax=Arthrobacter psychrolactophilus TaxID=92442 RepID=UPI0015E8CFB5|nr:hypothetical protein [Arthrobacter psychrolactophilus]
MKLPTSGGNVKKVDRFTQGLEDSLSSGVHNATEWATPHVEHAREWTTPRVEAALGWAVPRIERGIEQASPIVQDSLRKAAQYTADGVAAVTPMLQDGLEKLAPRISDAVDEATPHIQGALDKASPALASAKERVVHDFIPLVSDKLGDAAHAVETALEKTQLSHQVEVVAESVKKKKGSGKGWIVVGIIAAASAAAVAAWKASKPVADPWKTPATVVPAQAVVPAPVPADDGALEDAAKVADTEVEEETK